MRVNKFVAIATGLSRRAADVAIAAGRITVNGDTASVGQEVVPTDTILLDGQPLAVKAYLTILLNKPRGYITSRAGQGARTIYDLLPAELHHLKPVGRLDKDSSGALLLTNDGQLAEQLSHPRYHKVKVYEIKLDRSLQPLHRQIIQDRGIQLEDGPSRFQIERLADDDYAWRITMHEGRKRQIRRTFAALGYTVTRLHRTSFGSYALGDLPSGQWRRQSSGQ